MQRIPSFKIQDSTRPALFVQFDQLEADALEIRREQKGPIDEIRARLTVMEGRALRDALSELLPKAEPTTEESERKRLAERIRDAILEDVTSRHGWKQEWTQFHLGLRNEITETWLSLIEAELARGG